MGNEINISGANIIYEIPIFGGIKITETQVNSLLVILLVFIICKVLTAGLKVKPTSKRQIVAEFLVEKARGLVKGNMGEKHINFTPFIMALLTISTLSSLLSLLGLYPPTADLNTILGWSITVFVLLTREKLKGGIGGYLKGYLEPFALFAPLFAHTQPLYCPSAPSQLSSPCSAKKTPPTEPIKKTSVIGFTPHCRCLLIKRFYTYNIS
jgi:F-type H+-transporting ATPase subunit a